MHTFECVYWEKQSIKEWENMTLMLKTEWKGVLTSVYYSAFICSKQFTLNNEVAEEQ